MMADSNEKTGPEPWFINRDEWMADKPKAVTPNDDYRPLPLVVIGHTVSSACYNFADCASGVRFVQDYHMNELQFSDIGYNFVIGGDGRVYEGRGWKAIGAHAKGFNNFSIGIAYIGDYNRNNSRKPLDFSERQVNSTQQLIALGVREGYLRSDYQLVGYCDVRGGSSPGDIVYNEITKWPHYRKGNYTKKCF